MRLPSINNETASSIWNAMNDQGAYDPALLSIDYRGDDAEEKLSAIDVEPLRDALDEIMDSYAGQFANGKPKSKGGLVDADLVKPVHSVCSEFADADQLSDLGFWRWLSNAALDGYFWKFVAWRYEKREQVNWGITSPRNSIEVLLYRSWLRGHKMYDPDLADPYEYAKKGSSDVWRSQILRQDFGKDRNFVKAFLDFCWDENGDRRIGDTKLRTQLIPALRSWTSNASYEHLTYDECLELITDRSAIEI